jgi:hypothetical protein
MSTTPPPIGTQTNPDVSVSGPVPNDTDHLMLDSDGLINHVKPEDVPQAIKVGGKLAVRIFDPEGNSGVVPMDSAHDAINAGGTLTLSKDQKDKIAKRQAQNALDKTDTEMSKGGIGVATGVAKGLVGTMKNVADLAAGPGTSDKMQGLNTVYTNPISNEEYAGKMAEQTAEFAAGMGNFSSGARALADEFVNGTKEAPAVAKELLEHLAPAHQQ